MADSVLDGRDYVALRRLSTKDDVTLAAVGETCERVPATSLPFLLASGKIARITVTETLSIDADDGTQAPNETPVVARRRRR